MANLRQHISLSKLDIEQPRHKPKAMVKPPKRDNISHGAKLKDGISQIRRDLELAKTSSKLMLSPVAIFTLNTVQSIDEKHLRRSGLTVLDEDTDRNIIVLSEDNAAKLEKKIDEYSQGLKDGQKNPSHNWLAALTGEMKNLTPEQRIGAKLKAEGIKSDKEYRVDIEYWALPDANKRRELIDRLDKYLEYCGGRLLDKYNVKSLTIARVKILGEFLIPLLELQEIRVIDLPPSGDLSTRQILERPLNEFRGSISYPPDGAPGICVIDSGIMPNHPLLSKAVGDTRAFPNSERVVDATGHGTQVAGIALYGDVRRCIDSSTFEPTFYIYSARVLNEDNQFDENQLIVNQMREAINYFHNQYGCRIYNISLGDATQIYDDGKPSPWAYILDTLARDLNIVIVVAAGNFPVVGAQEDADYIYQNYPQYYLDGRKESRIIEPATAANVITVGSLAHTDKSYMNARYPDDVRYRPIADIDKPSPFTRRGPGINNAIKPDVSEYGGNVLWTGDRGLIQDPGLSIVSLNKEYRERLFATEIGSSVAAPKVSHLAAQILQHYPKASANLIRAFIANAASIPKVARETFSEDDLLNLYGYGKPEVERAIFSDDARVTLFADDAIPLDMIHLYEIPIPDEFQNLAGRRRISISLAYDPPVRNTRNEYLGIKMGFRLFRGLDAAQITDWYSKRTNEFDPDKINLKHQCTMLPKPTRREAGTLQKAIFTGKSNRVFTDYSAKGGNFHLLVTCQSTWASADEFGNQRYALVVTIEHEDMSIQLYNLVAQRVQTRERIRFRY